VLYDSDESDPSFRWKAYGQLFKPRPDGSGWPGIRNIALAHGADVSKLEEPPPTDSAARIILAPQEGIDNELHFAAVQKVGGQYLMLFESDRFDRNPIHGDLRLAVSDDGRKFRRVHAQMPLVATGPKGMWDENLLVTNSAGWQEVGDEIWIHYFGCPRMYDDWPAQYSPMGGERRGCMFAPVYLGVATLPRDRFAYAAGPGTIITKPIDSKSGEIWLNADGDGISITSLDPSGKVQARGSLTPDRRQTVYRKVKWTDGQPSASAASLEIKLTDRDRVYSIAF
jgi:hypothetical protein